MDKEIKFKIKYEGGDADKNRLELYDAGVSIHGVARAIAISMHAFLNNGAIRSRVEKISGAKIYIQPSRQGSFEELIIIAINSDLVSGIGVSVAATASWEFIKWSWAKATGQDVEEPTSRHAKKILKQNDDLEAELVIALEKPLEQFHRPLASNEDMRISVTRHQTTDSIHFDQQTLAHVETTTESSLSYNIVCNVTRYNILSGNGRFYDDQLEKTISFGLDSEVSAGEKQILTWSMSQRTKGKDGKIIVDANRIVNKRGETKRYVVVEVRKMDN